MKSLGVYKREEFYEMFNSGQISVCLLSQLNASLQERNPLQLSQPSSLWKNSKTFVSWKFLFEEIRTL